MRMDYDWLSYGTNISIISEMQYSGTATPGNHALQFQESKKKKKRLLCSFTGFKSLQEISGARLWMKWGLSRRVKCLKMKWIKNTNRETERERASEINLERPGTLKACDVNAGFEGQVQGHCLQGNVQIACMESMRMSAGKKSCVSV